MMFQIRQRMAALFAVATLMPAGLAAAQTPQVPAIPVVKQSDLARVDRRPARNGRSESMNSEKKKAKNFSYSYLLPFGVGQFEREKTILGTAVATGQAGFLLMYFDRLNAVRASNADAADVMKGVDTSTAGNDPGIVAFLDQNEKFTLQAQQQANLALIGFFALYTAGVVEAVLDPFAHMGSTRGSSGGKKKKRPFADNDDEESASGLVQDLKEEQRKSKVGVFVQPAGPAPSIGLSLQKPL